MTSDERVRISLLFQVFRTNEVTARLVSRALEPTGIRGDDYAVYSYLLHGPMTLTELADGTGMPLTTASGYVQRFEDRGHVQKTRNPEDGRSRLISLTDETRDWVLEAAKIFTKTIEHLDSVMKAEGVDVIALIDKLDLLQVLIEKALDDLDKPTHG